LTKNWALGSESTICGYSSVHKTSDLVQVRRPWRGHWLSAYELGARGAWLVGVKAGRNHRNRRGFGLESGRRLRQRTLGDRAAHGHLVSSRRGNLLRSRSARGGNRRSAAAAARTARVAAVAGTPTMAETAEEPATAAIAARIAAGLLRAARPYGCAALRLAAATIAAHPTAMATAQTAAKRLAATTCWSAASRNRVAADGLTLGRTGRRTTTTAAGEQATHMATHTVAKRFATTWVATTAARTAGHGGSERRTCRRRGRNLARGQPSRRH